MYVLLLKFAIPFGDKSDWEVYNDLEAAKIALERHQKTTQVIFGQRLVQHIIFKVEEQK